MSGPHLPDGDHLMPRALSGVSVDLTASHTDRIMDEGTHQHRWTVTVWWPSDPWRDGRVVRETLKTILSPYQGVVLPDTLWSQEDIAKMVAGVMGNIVRVEVRRPLEGFYCVVDL